MAEKMNIKSFKIILIVAAIIVFLIIGFAVSKNKKNGWQKSNEVDDIVINEKDSKEVKIQKIEKKIELLNDKLDEMQDKINIESEKANSLYTERVKLMNNPNGGVQPTEGQIPEEN